MIQRPLQNSKWLMKNVLSGSHWWKLPMLYSCTRKCDGKLVDSYSLIFIIKTLRIWISNVITFYFSWHLGSCSRFFIWRCNNRDIWLFLRTNNSLIFILSFIILRIYLKCFVHIIFIRTYRFPIKLTIFYKNSSNFKHKSYVISNFKLVDKLCNNFF